MHPLERTSGVLHLLRTDLTGSGGGGQSPPGAIKELPETLLVLFAQLCWTSRHLMISEALSRCMQTMATVSSTVIRNSGRTNIRVGCALTSKLAQFD